MMSILQEKFSLAKDFGHERAHMKAALKRDVNAPPKFILHRCELCYQSHHMIFRIFCLSLLALFLVRAVDAASNPTPSPTPKKSFFGLKPNVNPSATPSKAGAALGRGAHPVAERSEPGPTPKSTPQPKRTPKPSPSPKKSSTPSEKPARSTSPKLSPTAAKEKSPTPKPSPSVSAIPTATPTEPPSPAPSASPAPASKLELTLTKFEPPHGAPGDADYRSARLSYRINVPAKMDFPVITFSVESASGKLLQRRFALPKGSASIEPNDDTERTVALDPEPRDDWADALAKSDKAKFTWSIEDAGSGEVEMPVKKSWP